MNSNGLQAAHQSPPHIHEDRSLAVGSMPLLKQSDLTPIEKVDPGGIRAEVVEFCLSMERRHSEFGDRFGF